VELPDGRSLRAAPVGFDGTNDLAILHIVDLGLPALHIVDAREGEAAAMLGYPGDGPFDAQPARVGTTAAVFAPDYSRRFVERTITSIRARVRHGNSGGPIVNRRGAVEASVFGARRSGDAGYGVPGEVVRETLEDVDMSGVSTGRCLP
jgi:S1-C subfamily serine protease